MSGTQAASAVFDYMTGQLRDTHPALLADFAARSDAAVQAHTPELDIAYAAHPRAVFDLFRASAPRATLLYFHAGYWQSRDKAPFRFLAPALAAAGFNVAFANYPLCPDVDLATLVETALLAVPAVMHRAGPVPMIAAGHSAGAHLAIEILLQPKQIQAAWPQPVIGGLAISGVYDLAPLLPTPLNDRLGLDAAAAIRHSPLHHVTPGCAPALFLVGGTETPGFQTQNAAMHTAWQTHGNQAWSLTIDDADHFSVLLALATPQVIAPLQAMAAQSPGSTGS